MHPGSLVMSQAVSVNRLCISICFLCRVISADSYSASMTSFAARSLRMLSRTR